MQRCHVVLSLPVLLSAFLLLVHRSDAYLSKVVSNSYHYKRWEQTEKKAPDIPEIFLPSALHLCGKMLLHAHKFPVTQGLPALIEHSWERFPATAGRALPGRSRHRRGVTAVTWPAPPQETRRVNRSSIAFHIPKLQHSSSMSLRRDIKVNSELVNHAVHHSLRPQ